MARMLRRVAMLLPAAVCAWSPGQLAPALRQVPAVTFAAAQLCTRCPPPKSEMPNLDGTGSFRDIVEYPTTIGIKIIGLNEGDFVQDMLNVCREVTKQKAEDVEVKWRDKGKYRAITINLTFQDADMVYATYAAINKDPRVKFKL